MQQPTALLLFSRTAKSEAASKVFVQKHRPTNTKLCSELISQTLTIANATGLPVYQIDEHLQRGNTFGERLANAMDVVFNAGFSSIIVIGNDCPSLTTQKIHTALNHLQNNKVVLGPDHRGGVYLIGLHKAVFTKEKIIINDWQSNKLIQDLEQNFACQPLIKLEVLNDVNTFTDLVHSKYQLPSYTLLAILIESILASITSINNYFSITSTNLKATIFGLRAPPAL